MPTSVLVAGYGKVYQIQRLPFRTYYSQVDRIVEKAETFLFIGYGFNDLHLNRGFHGIRKGTRPRPVVVIDWAEDNQESLRTRNDAWAKNLWRTAPFNADEIATRRWRHTTPHVFSLKENNEFEVSTNPLYPLSVWYGGFIKACQHYDLIKDELEQ